MGNLLQDIRYGNPARWQRNRASQIVAFLTLALGIGANTAILQRGAKRTSPSAALPEPDQLVEIFNTYPAQSQGEDCRPVTNAIGSSRIRVFPRWALTFESRKIQLDGRG